jgi:hypothetical protein
MDNTNWQQLALATLVGTVVSGGAMMFRGDMLGEQAANAAEERIEKKIVEVKKDIGDDVKEIRDAILRLEEKYDKVQARR